MSSIVIFAGTSEGRALSEWLSERRVSHDVCVATEYGSQVMGEDKYASVFQGRMTSSEMAAFLTQREVMAVVDATHPYAREASANIMKAAEETGVRYIRLDRMIGEEDPEGGADNERIRWFDSAENCASYLKETEGNILLTTGSKDLETFAEDEAVRERLIVRVIPSAESIGICTGCRIPGSRIIAMQGPFSEAMNRSIIEQYDIKIMVSKYSGSRGGFEEKKQAAAGAGIDLLVIGKGAEQDEHSEPAERYSFEQVKVILEDMCISDRTIRISLVGCGMGGRDSLTGHGARTIEEAEAVFGAKRLIESLDINKDSYAYYKGEDILPVILKEKKNSVILFSGDTGFYSGAAGVYEILSHAVNEGKLNASLSIIPGISSISALAALSGMRWDDACLASIHGRGNDGSWEREVIRCVAFNKKTILLISGAEDVKKVCDLLTERGLGNAIITAGYQMEAEDEEIKTFPASECDGINKEGLYTLLILNQDAVMPLFGSSIPDGQFIREKVPMTKEEVRTVSISKLRLEADSVLYDIGSGSGSISVQAALSVPGVRVIAIEKDQAAYELSEKNVRQMKAAGVRLIAGEAPDCLEMKGLPVPTHAFIGGSGGNLKEIVSKLFNMNPDVRIVINAVSLETISQISALAAEYEDKGSEIISINVSRSGKLGAYHLMKAENPVYICSLGGRGQ